MFLKLYKHSSVKRILVISLSNIGDVVLTAPVIDILLRDFPSAKLSILVGPKAASLFEGNPHLDQVHVYDKHLPPLQKVQWTLNLREFHYDLVVDLRNSMMGFFLWPKWLTTPIVRKDKNLHLKEKHLNRLRSMYDFGSSHAPSLAIMPSPKDDALVDRMTDDFLKRKPFIVIAPQAADITKTWPSEGFVELVDLITHQYGLKIVMVGSEKEIAVIDHICQKTKEPVLNLAGRLNLIQVAALLKRSKLAIVHDSGPMHIASYFNVPVVALFGPTPPQRYGPWSLLHKIVHRNKECYRCLKPESDLSHNCMVAIKVKDVFDAFKEVYEKL